MEKKRTLTADELNKIRLEEDLLKEDINGMCVSDNEHELLEMFWFANLRIKTIFEVCLDKFIDNGDE